MAALTTRGLSRQFGETEALRGVDLEVSGPGVFGFLGVNGAGKTTTLRILAGLLAPSSGEVLLFDRPLSPRDLSTRRRIGYLPQQPTFHQWMRGREVLHFTASLFGMKRTTARRRSSELLERLGLTAAADRRVGGYSGGMVQRLGIAQALVNDPDLLLLDEPVSALDPVGRAEMLGLLRELGVTKTVFMSSHILADIERVCAQVAILDRGRVVVREHTETLRQRYLLPLFEVEVTGDADPLLQALEAAPWVQRCQRLDGDQVTTKLRVEVRDMEVAQRQLPRLIAEGQLGLVRLTEGVPTLEEVFINLVGRGPGREEGAP